MRLNNATAGQRWHIGYKLDDSLKLSAFPSLLLITTMIVPIQLILIPLLPWFRSLGLDQGAWQYVGIVLVHTGFGAGWAVFMLSAFFREVPQEMLEEAIDDLPDGVALAVWHPSCTPPAMTSI